VIRVEIVLKQSRWNGSEPISKPRERAIKRAILETVGERAEADDLEVVRIQFLAPAPKRRA